MPRDFPGRHLFIVEAQDYLDMGTPRIFCRDFSFIYRAISSLPDSFTLKVPELNVFLTNDSPATGWHPCLLEKAFRS